MQNVKFHPFAQTAYRSEWQRIRARIWCIFFYDYCKWIIIANHNNKNETILFVGYRLEMQHYGLAGRARVFTRKRERERKREKKNEIRHTSFFSAKRFFFFHFCSEYLGNRHEPLVCHFCFYLVLVAVIKHFMHSTVWSCIDLIMQTHSSLICSNIDLISGNLFQIGWSHSDGSLQSNHFEKERWIWF